jgi:signal transduction histidine kinase
MAISKRLVLRSGFGIMIALLVISTIMAYRVQESFSEKSVEIHRRFVHEQELLTNLRRTLWSSAIALRDHFINPEPSSTDFAERLDVFEREALSQVQQLASSSTRTEAVSALRGQFTDLWNVVRTASLAQWDARQKYNFVQQEVVPRRNAAGQLLREIERANHASLADSQVEFRSMRAAATQRLLALLGACLLCGLIVAWFSTRHSEHLEQQAAERFTEVSEAKLELERLSARLMEVQEEERTRLSRELHDEIVQNLAVLKMDIVHAHAVTALKAPELNETLTRTRNIAETTVQSVRNISLLLRPSLLDDLGLVPALQWQAEEFSRRTGIPCELEESLADDNFSEAVKTCVYRVTQEALRNCEKHSQASLVRVVIRQQEQRLVITVEDNGVGFPPQAARQLKRRLPQQLGMLGMRERAAALGGSLSVTDRTGGGAVVSLVIPVSSTIRETLAAQVRV